MVLIEGRDKIAGAQLIARKFALKLEIAGLRRSRGRSVYSICKSEYGLRGSRESVYAQMVTLVEELLAS